MKPRTARTKGRQSPSLETRRNNLETWLDPGQAYQKEIKQNVVVEAGWGKLIFANTYSSHAAFLEELKKERTGQRNLGFYPTDPHVLVSLAPNEVFLDPSHTFRIPFERYEQAERKNTRLSVRRLRRENDLDEVNRILLSRDMVPLKPEWVLNKRNASEILYFVAQSTKTGDIVGFVNGVDHKQVFNDPENGTSLWSLAVDPRSALPGIGEALTRYLIEHFIARGRAYLDLSVMHENKNAIRLYKRLGFQRIPVFCVKLKNSINTALYTASTPDGDLNPYAQIIVNEAVKRGIDVKILDREAAYFSLSYGGRKITCRESLTDLTSAIAMSRCADKTVTAKLLNAHKIRVPEQMTYDGDLKKAAAFLDKVGTAVVKPADGEQGEGVHVGITTRQALKASLEALARHRHRAIIEEMVKGLDIRVIVIDYQFVAAALRRPPEIVGDGKTPVKNLILRLNKRRMAATHGESRVPFDDETLRALKEQGLRLNSTPADGHIIQVRKTANVHTGGTISDITPQIPTWLKKVAERAATLLEIPVTGLDFIVPGLDSRTYWVIEANERPGLANHEPQPTAEKFIDFLFPLTRKDIAHGGLEN